MSRDSRLTEIHAAEIANSVVFMFVNMFAYNVIRHVAGSIGVERLSMTFHEIKSAKNTIAIRTLDAAIQLEHFSNVPEDLVTELYDSVKGVILVEDIVRHLAWDRLYYYRCAYDVQQRLCAHLGIKMLAATRDEDHKKS